MSTEAARPYLRTVDASASDASATTTRKYGVELPQLVPPNATPLERAMESAITKAFELKNPIREIASPDTCPAPLLPWLAWAMGVRDWDSTWNEEAKRNVIKSSFAVYSAKGTIGALEQALAPLGYTITVHEPEDTPYIFSLHVKSPEELTEEKKNLIISVVNTNKNARSRLSHITNEVGVDGGYFIGAAMLCETTLEVRPANSTHATVQLPMSFVMGARANIHVKA